MTQIHATPEDVASGPMITLPLRMKSEVLPDSSPVEATPSSSSTVSSTDKVALALGCSRKDVDDAVDLIDSVKARFATTQPEIYDDFLTIFEIYKSGKSNSKIVYLQVVRLFKTTAPDLIEKFKKFVPHIAVQMSTEYGASFENGV